LYGLVRFLSLSEISIQPAVTATANGDLYVQWKNEGHSLSVHFMGTFTAKYALVKPNQKHAEKWSYSSGATTVDALWEEMAVLRLPNGLLR
jgi:lipocalin